MIHIPLLSYVKPLFQWNTILFELQPLFQWYTIIPCDTPSSLSNNWYSSDTQSPLEIHLLFQWYTILFWATTTFPVIHNHSLRYNRYSSDTQSSLEIPLLYQWYTVLFWDTTAIPVIHNHPLRYTCYTSDTQSSFELQPLFQWYTIIPWDTPAIAAIHHPLLSYCTPAIPELYLNTKCWSKAVLICYGNPGITLNHIAKNVCLIAVLHCHCAIYNRKLYHAQCVHRTFYGWTRKRWHRMGTAHGGKCTGPPNIQCAA